MESRGCPAPHSLPCLTFPARAMADPSQPWGRSRLHRSLQPFLYPQRAERGPISKAGAGAAGVLLGEEGNGKLIVWGMTACWRVSEV